MFPKLTLSLGHFKAKPSCWPYAQVKYESHVLLFI